MTTDSEHSQLGWRRQRIALSNGHLVRYTITVVINLIAEWALFLGVLVYAFGQGGARATGLASLALLTPNIFIAPLAAAAAERYPPQRVRLAAMSIQSVAWATAALAAYAELRLAGVVAPAMVGLAATTALGPAAAVLRPAIVRTSTELTIANLWLTYSNGVGVLAAPLIATFALHLGGAGAVVASAAGLSIVAMIVAIVRRPVDPPGGSNETDRLGPFALMGRALADVRSRPGLLGVMAIAGGQLFVVGALDIAVVVAAQDGIDLGDGGPGILNMMFGAGAVLAMFASTILMKRGRLAPVLIVAMAAAGAAALVLGIALSTIAALVLLPIIGLMYSISKALSQLLLQRSSDPKSLGSVFAVLEFTEGLGLLLGSVVTQLLINLWGVRSAFVGIAGLFLLMWLLTNRSIRTADRSADVPVVAMSLLSRVPVFAPLPRPALEAVARASSEVHVQPGDVVIQAGDTGDRFYAVGDGTFDVEVEGNIVGEIERGGSFGELALLANVPRAATITARTAGTLTAIDRTPFLIAVTGHDSARQAAWGVMQRHHGDETPVAGPDEFDVPTDHHDDGGGPDR